MKRLGLFLVGILLLCATSCDCPDCGVAKFSIDTKIFLVTKHADGSQTCAPEAIKFTTSYEWTASNSAPKYIDFSTTEGTGGVFHFPVRLTSEFFETFRTNPGQFTIDAIGCRVGRIEFVSSGGERLVATIYLKDAMVLCFDTNGGQGRVPEPMGFVAGEEVTLPGNTTGMTYSSKSFVGWGTMADGSGVFYDDGSKAIFGSSILLYALWEGDGSSADGPKYIYNRRTLMEVNNDPSLHYLVVADFDANEDEENGVYYPSWKPIRTFTGALNGNNHHIQYTIEATSTNQVGREYYGLFSVLGDDAAVGLVKDLTVSGSIKVNSQTIIVCGGIAGSLFRGSITRCLSEVELNTEKTVTGMGMNPFSGGIVGDSYNGNIEYCVFTGSIRNTTANGSLGQLYTGGIVGYNFASSIRYCISTGPISGEALVSADFGDAYTGGIAGVNQGTIQYCASSSLVTGKGEVVESGGIVGMHGVAGASVSYSVALNKGMTAGSPAIIAVKTTDAAVSHQFWLGRIVGMSDALATMSNNYALSDMYVQRFTDPIGTVAGGMATNKNGEDIAVGNAGNQSWWTGIGWSGTHWDFSTLSSLGVPWPQDTPKPE